MKKILSIVIMAIFLLQNLAFAQVNNATNIINCSKNIDDAFCKSINIEKKQIGLNSYLKKNYSGYSYTIKNEQEHPIKIYQVGSFYPSSKTISRYKEVRQDKRFPKNIGILLIAIICPLVIVSYDPTGEYCYVNPYYDLYLSPIVNTAFVPYLAIKDKRDDKKAKLESYNFNEQVEEMTLKKDETSKFAILCSNNKRRLWVKSEIQINILDLTTNQKYLVYK